MDLKIWRFECAESEAVAVFDVVEGRGDGGGVNAGVRDFGVVLASGSLSFLVNCL